MFNTFSVDHFDGHITACIIVTMTSCTVVYSVNVNVKTF